MFTNHDQFTILLWFFSMFCSLFGKWKSLSCLTLCDPMDDTVHGILQARILEWVVFPFFRGSFQPRDQTQDWKWALKRNLVVFYPFVACFIIDVEFKLKKICSYYYILQWLKLRFWWWHPRGFREAFLGGMDPERGGQDRWTDRRAGQ